MRFRTRLERTKLRITLLFILNVLAKRSSLVDNDDWTYSHTTNHGLTMALYKKVSDNEGRCIYEEWQCVAWRFIAACIFQELEPTAWRIRITHSQDSGLNGRPYCSDYSGVTIPKLYEFLG